MKPLSFLFNLVLLPFELLGQFLALLLCGSWQLLTKTLRSPWGLLVPCTLIALVLISFHLTRNPTELAESYVKSLETCDETEIPILLEALVQLGEPGIPGLVRSLRQPREAVFSAAQQKLNDELDRWESLDDSARLRRYRIFSQALLEQVRTLDEEGQNAAIRFSRRMLRNLVIAKDAVGNPEVTPVSRNCERLLTAIETRRKKTLAPNGPQNKADTETVARFENRAFDPTLMASMGRPFQRMDAAETVDDIDDRHNEFFAPRAEKLYAYHDSEQFQKQLGTPYRRPGSVSLPLQRVETERGLHDDEMIASMTPVRRNPEPVEIPAAGTLTDSEFPAIFESETQGKIARNYLEKNADQEAKKKSRFPVDSVVSDADFFLPRELREISLERIPDLSSARLMRLLQHSDERYVSEARKTLIARDGFRDTHLKLAFRLFHPAPSVREEIVAMIPNTTGVQPQVWLSVLLEDPNSDVRYRAASFLATAGDLSMQKILIDRGKRDPDSRIVNLAEQLQEQQRLRVRR